MPKPQGKADAKEKSKEMEEMEGRRSGEVREKRKENKRHYARREYKQTQETACAGVTFPLLLARARPSLRVCVSALFLCYLFHASVRSCLSHKERRMLRKRQGNIKKTVHGNWAE